jgi:hypothetical protein
MNPPFEQTLVEVWRQVLVENARVVELDGKRYPVRITPRKGFFSQSFRLQSALRGRKPQVEVASARRKLPDNDSALPRLLMAVYTPLLRCATASELASVAAGYGLKQTGSCCQVPRFAFLGLARLRRNRELSFRGIWEQRRVPCRNTSISVSPVKRNSLRFYLLPNMRRVTSSVPSVAARRLNSSGQPSSRPLLKRVEPVLLETIADTNGMRL